MTKLPAAVGSLKSNEKVMWENEEETKRIDLNNDMNGSCNRVQATFARNVIDLGDGRPHSDCNTNNNLTGDNDHGSECNDDYHEEKGVDEGEQEQGEEDDDFNEPLGYQSFLYDVNIEYSLGGNLSSSLSFEHCFKMKCLPYMIEKNKCPSDLHTFKPIDVTRETCAFLGNSEYVPVPNYNSKRVVVELVSAKLSTSNANAIRSNSSFTNLAILDEDGPSPAIAASTYSDISSLRSYNGHSSIQPSNTGVKSLARSPNPREVNLTTLSTSPSSSKRFVNYTIVIKTVPGLDKHPVVIERRFSDFLRLYQGLKEDETLASLVEKNINFPKKVYMGNFSLEKIAQRSIEFNRLLHLCMSEYSLLRSPPFVSFLIDKELKEAHRLSLLGDLDDAQALFETVNSIKQKLYAKFEN